MSKGKRFESDRRLLRFGVDPLNAVEDALHLPHAGRIDALLGEPRRYAAAPTAAATSSATREWFTKNAALAPELRSIPQSLLRPPRRRSEGRAYSSLAPSAPSPKDRSCVTTARCPSREGRSHPVFSLRPATGTRRPDLRAPATCPSIGKITSALIKLAPRARR